jgi:Ribosomal protein L11 methylase
MECGKPSHFIDTPENIDHHPASFRDNNAYLFYYGKSGILYRALADSYLGDYNLLHSSGLYPELMRRGWLVPHTIAEVPVPPGCSLVLQPEVLPFISYPYEWSFSQLKKAALLTLDIASLALQHGLILKDASGFNVAWKNGQPIFIDLPSFRRLEPGEPWPAYQQFCAHFLAPLALMKYTDLRLQKLFLCNIAGLPLDLTSKLLPRRTWLRMGLLIHLHLHARSQLKHAGVDKKVEVNLSTQTLRNLLHHLRLAVEGLRLPPTKTEWGDYYNDTNYTEDQFQAKKDIVGGWLDRMSPNRVCDLGANDGTFSRIAAQKAKLVISADIDPIAVDKNFNYVTDRRITNILPIIQDLTQPSPALGWELKERMPLQERLKADLGLALALVHHLVIGNNTPFRKFFSFLANTAPTWIVEFPAKEDSQVQRLLRNREDIFTDYSRHGFEAALYDSFIIHERREIEGTHRTLYLITLK